MLKDVAIPDLGNSNPVDVIEILVKPGDKVNAETPLISLESDKASMEVPAPFAGVVKELKVKVGDKVTQGMVVLSLETIDVAAEKPAVKTEAIKPAAPVAATIPAKTETTVSASIVAPRDVLLPDLGTTAKVDVIEVLVKVGDTVTAEQPLLTLEGDKASMEVPAPFSGVLKSISVKVGDKVSNGDKVMVIEAVQTGTMPAPSQAPAVREEKSTTAAATTTPATAAEPAANGEAFAGPSVRRFARELGVDLGKVKGSGRKGRVQQEDVQAYVKAHMAQAAAGNNNQGGFALPQAPVVDFSKFGETETQPLSRIKKISGANLQRNWILVPHVTQFDEADITNLEEFRKTANQDAQKLGLKITPLVFIMKAVVAALKAYPSFNASLSADGESLIMKKYFHIGVAVDTPNGLVVPVIRDVDKKGIHDLSRELAEMSEKARKKTLTANDMQGSSFTISSLGGIGGTAFTPIVNLPDVAILGISRSSIKPVYENGQFVPRLMLPLSLSYDHRVIDGAEGARFSRYLAEVLSDIRKLLF